MKQEKTPRRPVSGKTSIIPPPLFPKRPSVEGIEKATQKKAFLSAAAKEIGMDPNSLASWICKRNPQEETMPDGKKRIRVDLSFNFTIRPFFVEERVGVNSLISETSLGTIKAYFSLRERIRKGELAPASDGFHTRTLKKEYMDALKEFIPPRVRFEKDPNTPLLIFQRLNLPRFRVPVYEYNGSYFCKPAHADAIVFAAKLWCGTSYSRAREVPKAMAEIGKYSDASKLPYGLGMKIWVLRAYLLDCVSGMHETRMDFAYSRTIQEFLVYGQKDYLSVSP